MHIVQRIALVILLVYTLLLTYWMLFGFGRYPHAHYMYNVIPFATIKQFLTVELLNTRVALINLIGNIAVFIPFGMLLPIIGGRKIVRAYGIFLVALIVMELTQLISRRGSLDIDDIILNSFGYWLGYGMYVVLKILLRNKGDKRLGDN
jgi:glycopeptide antibiotics resistance protein